MKKRGTAALLALFFGSVGIHYFYIGDKVKGLSMLILSCIGVGLIIFPVIAFLDAIKLFYMDDKTFDFYLSNMVSNETNFLQFICFINFKDKNYNSEINKYELLTKYINLKESNSINDNEFNAFKSLILK